MMSELEVRGKGSGKALIICVSGTVPKGGVKKSEKIAHIINRRSLRNIHI